MFDTGVVPYGAGVWGYNKAPPLEVNQNRAGRYFIGIHKYAPNVGVTGDLGWEDVEKGLCQMCTLNEIDDQCHFVCVCPVYKHCRGIYLEVHV